MIWRSLKLRLFLAASIFIIGALIIYGNVLAGIFKSHVSERLYVELEAHLNQLTAIVEITDDNEILVEESMASARFNKPFGGLYWHIVTPGMQELSSRSLWDQVLSLPEAGKTPGLITRYDNIAFNNGHLLAIERTVLIANEAKQHRVRMILAMDRADLERAIVLFDADVLKLVVLLALFLVAAAGAQILVGLRPLATLSTKLANLGSNTSGSRSKGLEGEFPIEVERLVDGLNALLGERAQMVDKARARASDLAHGLKTPLAILAAESRALKSTGEAELAREISTQVDAMNRHVERQLVMARMGAKSAMAGNDTVLKPLLEKYVRTFKKLPTGAKLHWQLDVADDLKVKMDELDLEEIVGNLFDNASKWAKTKVKVSAVGKTDIVEITVSDDGCGVPGSKISSIVERGHRLDEIKSGSGLGLAIVSDIVDAYEGKLHIENSPAGGLMVSVQLPG